VLGKLYRRVHDAFHPKHRLRVACDVRSPREPGFRA
jgi:hypothetical protein